jgi:O-antigen/teichoic acid export membrane protein
VTRRPGRRRSENDTRVEARIARGAASNYAGQFVVLATALLLTPFVLHRVGPTAYGLWVLATALGGYGGLLDVGISSAVQKYVAEHRARDLPHEVSALVATAFALYAVLGLAALALLGVLASFVPDMFGVASGQRGVATWLTVIVGLQLLVSLPAATPAAVLRGSHRFDLTNFLVIVSTLLTAALTVVVLLLGGGIVAVAAVGVAVLAFMQIPAVWLMRRAAPELRFELSAVTRRTIRMVLSFSASVFAVRVAGVLTQRTDAIVIGAALPVRMVTPYSLGQRLAEVIMLLTNQFVQVLLPLASELDALQDRRRLRTVYLSATRIALALAIALAATVGILGSSILSVWIGETYSRYGYVVSILAAAAAVDTLNWPGASLLTGMARHRPLARIALATGVVNVGLSIVLVQPYGLTGVAVGTLLPSVVASILFVLPYTLRTIGIGASEFVLDVLRPNAVPAAVILGMLFAGRAMFDTDRPAVLAFTITAALSVYLAAYLRFSASRVETEFYRGVAVSLRRTIVHCSWALVARRGPRP